VRRGLSLKSVVRDPQQVGRERAETSAVEVMKN
jgi:hypothetical protein